MAAEILGLSIPGPLTFLGVGRACLRRCAENHLTGWPSGAKKGDSEAWTTEMGIPWAQEVRERAPGPQPVPRETPQQEPVWYISPRKEGRAWRIRGRGQQEKELDVGAGSRYVAGSSLQA